MRRIDRPSVTLIFTLLVWMPAAAQVVAVTATVETDPVPHSGDAADDPAIWVHPTSPGLSTIIGTDKLGGLGVYDMAGAEIQFLPDGDLNNVDVRYNFPLGGAYVDIVTAADRSDDSISVYVVDSETRQLRDIAAGTLDAGLTVYGSCMYRSPINGEFYFFVNSKTGDVEQWRLFDNGQGAVDAELMRTFDVGSQTEGCVADDETGDFYIGEERTGIWKYSAEPDQGATRTQVDTTGSSGHLTADVEGLTIYYASDGSGYLIASSQGNHTYVIYSRTGDNAYIGTFEIDAGASIDGTSETDGIDVTSVPLGPTFPFGVFVVQDGSNSGGNQNYKLVRWDDIANSYDPSLTIDTDWNPRDFTPARPKHPKPPQNLFAE